MGTGKPFIEALLGQSETARKLQQFALVGATVLALLLTAFAGWFWWPWLWGLIPCVIVVLPGIRRLIDELWGLIAGLLVIALTLSTYVDASLASLAWSLAATVTAAGIAIWRNGGLVPLAAVAVAGVATIASTAVWWSGKADRDRAAADMAARDRQYQLSKLYPPSPRAAVLQLIDGVVTPPKRDMICFQFSPAAEQQFARAHGAADCEGALANLQRQITDFDGYVNYVYIPRTAEVDLSPGVVQLDACRLEFSSWLTGGSDNPGPQLGRFEFEQQFSNGWMVTRYEPCR